MTTLEQVVRKNETPGTPFGSGYYTYIRKKVEGVEAPLDVVQFSFEASTSTQTTTVEGWGVAIRTKTQDEPLREVRREESEVEIRNPDTGGSYEVDDETQIARFKALKELEISDPNTGTTQKALYAHPNRDNTAMIPPGGDSQTAVVAGSSTANPSDSVTPESGSYGSNSIEAQISTLLGAYAEAAKPTVNPTTDNTISAP